MNKRHISAWILLLGLSVSLIAGCTGIKPQSAKLLRYNIGAEPETVDPRKSTGTPESIVEAQLFEGLVTVDADNLLAPAAAEKWEVSTDGVTYKFFLRENAGWSNGEPVTAYDFEYAWKSVLNPDFGSKYAYQLFCIKNAEEYNKRQVKADDVGIRVLDEKTLEVTLKSPIPYFLSLTAHHAYYPVNKKIAMANEKWASDPNTLVGNGPFKMTSWIHNSKIEFVKNNYYWESWKVALPKLEFFMVDNSTNELAMFESGQIDMGDNPPRSELERLVKENKIKTVPYFGTYYLRFNTTKAPFDNPKVRKALSLAFDRQYIVDKVTKGGETPALGFVPPNAPDAKKSEDFRKAGGNLLANNDITTAKRLLAEAGYPDGKGFPPIILIYNTNELFKNVCENVQDMWKKNLGIDVRAVNQDWKTFLNARRTGDYQIAGQRWIGDYMDAMTMLDVFVSGGGNNGQYVNPKYDELINVAKGTNNIAKRLKAMHDAEKVLIADDAAAAPVFFYTKTLLVKPNIQGYVCPATSVIYFKEATIE